MHDYRINGRTGELTAFFEKIEDEYLLEVVLGCYAPSLGFHCCCICAQEVLTVAFVGRGDIILEFPSLSQAFFCLCLVNFVSLSTPGVYELNIFSKSVHRMRD